MHIELIIVANDLLLGLRPDPFGPVISRALGSLGLTLERVTVVNASPEALEAAIAHTVDSGADILIVVTEDIASLTSEQAQPLPGPTTAGVRVERGATHIFALPRRAGDLEAILERHLLPQLERRAGRRAEHRLRISGQALDEVARRLIDLTDQNAGARLELLEHGPEVEVVVIAEATDSEAATALVRRLATEVCTRLGPEVHGPLGQDLFHATAEALRARQWSLATVELGLGGTVAGELTVDPQGRELLKLGLTVSRGDVAARLLDLTEAEVTEAARESWLGPAAAEALARGARRRGEAELGLALTGVLGPTRPTPSSPVGLVHFALADDRGVRSRHQRFTSLSRRQLRQWSASVAARLVLDRCREEGG